MGQALTKNGEVKAPADLLPETQIFASWTIADVRELWRRFQNQVFGFSIVEIQFESIMSFKESVSKYIDLETLFSVLDNDNDGRIDGLELLAGIALCSIGTFEEKTRFCFEMFDFNLNASLSKLEMIMLMVSCICGMILITGGKEENEPDIKLIEKMVDDAFLRCDLNQDGLISYDEFVVWSRTNRDLMAALEIFGKSSQNAKLDIDSDDSAELVDEGDVSDKSDFKFNENRREVYNLDALSNSSDDDLDIASIPWRAQSLEPTNFKPSKELSQSPDANLTLNWAFGYKSRNIRSNVNYIGPLNNSSPQYIVYNSAALVIVYDKVNNLQTFYQGHSSEITCIAVHPSGTIVATGDSNSQIHIWNAMTKTCSLLIKGLAHEGVQHISFSPSGDRIVTVGLDPDHSVAIYDSSSGQIISSARGIAQPNQVLDVAYSCSGTEISIVGRAEIKFFVGVHTNKRAIDSKIGKVGQAGKRQTFFCAAYMQDDCVVGCASGELYRFRNAVCIQVIQAHGLREPILTVYYNSTDVTLVTGGADCLVKTWDLTLNEVGNSLDLSEDLDGDGTADSGSLNSQVISVETRSNRILIGTKGGDIFEALTQQGSADSHVLVRLGWSHPYGELWGLATHPVRNEFVTCGDDKTIRIWNIQTRQQINIRVMPCAARAVCYSHTGEYICIGMEDGSACLMEADSKTLKVYSTWQHSNKAISVIQFSNDGQYIAVGSKDNNIYIYQTGDKKNYRRQAVCKGHSGAILFVDFSANSRYIRSNAADSHAVVWDMHGNIVKNESLVRNLSWHTYTCPYSWGLSGSWRNASRPDITTCHALPDLDDLVTGDLYGRINLFRYPSIPGALYQSYIGHSHAITCTRFTANRRYLISLGGLDKTILIWKHELELNENSDEDEALVTKDDSGCDDSSSDHEGNFRSDIPDVCAYSVIKEKINHLASSEELAEIVKADKLPGFDLVMPWKSTVIEPTKIELPSSGSTDIDITLQWVHGFRSFDCRNNIRYSASGAIVYNAACLAIVYNKASGKQKFLQGAHCDEVISIASHPTGQIFATGETGSKPSIFVWNAASVRILCKIDGHVNGVPLLAFNKAGNLLASIGQDDSNTLILYDWAKNIEIFTTPTSKKKILSCTFMSFDEKDFLQSMEKKRQSYNSTRLLPVPEDIIVTGGISHITFWWYQGKNVISQRGLWGRTSKDSILCLTSGFPNICVSGSATGKVMVWKNFKLQFVASDPHDKCKVECIWCVPGQIVSKDEFAETCLLASKKDKSREEQMNLVRDCSKLLRYFTGDENGIIAVWVLVDNEGKIELIKLKTFNTYVELQPTPLSKGIRSVCERDGVALIGTRGGEIYEFPIDWASTVREYEVSRAISTYAAELVTLPDSETLVNNSEPLVNKLDSTRQLFGHFKGEVWGLAVHPHKDLFFTAGDDCTLRCWALEDNKVKFYCKLPESAKAIDITPDGIEMIIGMNNGDVYSAYIADHIETTQKRGAVPVWGVEIFWTADERKDPIVPGREKFLHCSKIPKGATQWVQSIKVSPTYNLNGKPVNLLAVGSHDKCIYVYTYTKWFDFYKNGKTYQPVSENFKLVNVLKDHSSFISHIDFGINEKVSGSSATSGLDEFNASDCSNICMQSSSGAFEMFYWNPVSLEMIEMADPASSAKQSVESPRNEDTLMSSSTTSSRKMNKFRIISTSKLKDAIWASWTCPFGWPVQGVWPPQHDGINVTSVCRSNFYNQVPVLAAITDYGHLKLFNYPCVTPGSPDKCYRGHGLRVTNVLFSHNDRYCITVGGTDKCIFVWATDINEELLERQSLVTGGKDIQISISNNYEDYISGASAIIDKTPEASGLAPMKFKKSRHATSNVGKAWKNAAKEPTVWVENLNPDELPDASVELSFVYGYRGWDCRNNIGFADSRFEIIYFCGAVGVVYNTQSKLQVHNCEHDDDIISMAVHPEGHTVATGEIGAYPKIVLWDANTGVSIRIIKFHKRGVSQLAFSGSGTMLVSCGMDNDRLIAVHNISTGSLVGTGKAGRGVDIFCIAVYSDNVFCTAGRNHIKFWEFPAPTSPGGEMSSKGGIFNNKGVISRVVTTVAYLGTDAVTGMYDGSLLLWKERTCARSRDSVHKGAVSAMCAMPVSGGSTTDKSDSGPQIISGGKDGMIYVWTAQLESIWKLDINLAEPRPLLPEVQALAFRENKVLVGTRSSDIYEFNRLNQSESRLLVTGHHLDKAEVWGLATHPDQPKIITCGDDMTVRLWSTKTNSQLQILPLGVKARACAFSRDGSHVAIGTYDGRVKIVSEDLVAEYADVAVAKSWIQVLQFSPHSDFLAVGGHDNIVYIMDTTTFSIRGKGKGHTSFIQAIDFSVDSTKLQSCSGNHEMKFWDVDGNEIVKNSDTRDIQWSTYTCTIGWPVQGCWVDCDEDGGEVNSVDRSPDGQYVVTGCDNKRVNLYAYPCTKNEAKFISSKGHSEHITKVRYTFDGKSIISIGGLDKTILKFDLKS